MGQGEDMLQLVAGPMPKRAEAAITDATHCAIEIMAERIGGGNMRSAAIRRLLARGIAADPELMREAIDRAQQQRHAE